MKQSGSEAQIHMALHGIGGGASRFSAFACLNFVSLLLLQAKLQQASI
jgi:hypothetical protein